MLRKLSLVLLVSPAMALAQVPPAPPVTEVAPPAEMASPAEMAPTAEVTPPAPPVEAEAPPEEPKMKRVCHTEDVVGSAFPRKVCKMKPIRPPKQG